MLQTALLISLWWTKPLERFYMSLFLAKRYCFPVFDCSYFIFSEKKLFLLIDRRDPSANILLSGWEIKGAGVSLFSYGTGKP